MDAFFGTAEKLVSSMNSRREFDLLEIKFKELKAAAHTKKLKLDCSATTDALAAVANAEQASALHRVYDQLVLLKCKHRQHGDATDILRSTLAVFTIGAVPVNVKLQIRERLEYKGESPVVSRSTYSLSWCKQRSYPYNSYRVSADNEIWKINPDGKETNAFDLNQAEALFCKMKIGAMEPQEFILYLSKMMLDIVAQEGHLKIFRVDEDVSSFLLSELLMPEASTSRKQTKQRKFDSESSGEEEMRISRGNVCKRMRRMRMPSVVAPSD